MHECPECGQMCYCDGDDLLIPAGFVECSHECSPEAFDDDEAEHSHDDLDDWYGERW